MAFGLPSLPSFLSLGSSREVSSTSHESAGKTSGGETAKTLVHNAHQPSGALAGLANKPSGGRSGFKISSPKIKLSANTRNAINAAKNRGSQSPSTRDLSGPPTPHHEYGSHFSHFTPPDAHSTVSTHHAPAFEPEDDTHSLMSGDGNHIESDHGPSGPNGPNGPDGPDDADGPDDSNHASHESPVQTARADSDSMIKESLELSRINMQTNNMLAQIQNRIQLNMSLNQVSEQLGKNAKSLTQG